MEERFGSLNNNYEKIKRLLGEKFLLKSLQDQLSVNDFKEANYKMGSICYGEDINKLLWERKISTIYEVYKEYLDSLDINQLANVDFSNIGLILVRPECSYYKDLYRKFLYDRGLEVLYEKKMSIDFRQYLLLYYDSFILDDTMYDFPSRTFNYINNDCYLFVVTNNRLTNVADYLHSIKGKQGKYEPNTLRGDISYNLLKENVQNGQFIEEAIIPLDPIGAGRMLTRDLVEHDGSHNVSDIPLLFYAGQAVHVPNSKEIKRDLLTLCNEQETELILKKVRS